MTSTMSSLVIPTCLVIFYFSTCGGQQCPENWASYDDYCFSFDDSATGWMDAEATCRTVGGHLASPDTHQKDLNLRKFIQSRNYEYSVWIDGTDEFEVDFWVWASTNNKMTYTNWAPGEPNVLDRQMCVAVVDGDNHWRNRDCYEDYAFVCEVKADKSKRPTIG